MDIDDFVLLVIATAVALSGGWVLVMPTSRAAKAMAWITAVLIGSLGVVWAITAKEPLGIRYLVAGGLGALAAVTLVWLLDHIRNREAPAEMTIAQNQPTTGNQTIDVDGSGNIVNQGGDVSIGTYVNNPPKLPQQTHDAEIDRIAQLLSEGEQIRQTFRDGGDTNLIKSQYADWVGRTDSYLRTGVGASYAVQFENAHGSAWTGCLAGRSVEGCRYWQEIKGKTDALSGFITELRNASR
jgi:hypothetical protein